uniref:Uncharacterized protein n=1 Tax=Taeniopygia guttata TaxID=59729 RepID=A0A674HRM5_TAEGU
MAPTLAVQGSPPSERGGRVVPSLEKHPIGSYNAPYKERTRTNSSNPPLYLAKLPTPDRKGRSRHARSQDYKFMMRATAVHPLLPIKLTWKSPDPVWVEQWPLSKPRMTALLELVARELQKGHIEPSTSPWNTPVFVIPKRSGEGYRLVHDLREVNKTIQPMGPVQTLLPANSAIPKGQPCAVLDIKDCFFSIPLHAEDKEWFAFSIVFPNGERPNLRFQWKVLPQGLVDSPTICQITVDRALMPVRHSHPAATIIQYMDDILVAAPSAGQVHHLVSTITETLQANGFEIANTKIKRGPCVTFLGVGITNSYVTPPKIKVRRDIKTLHDMQRLVGSLQCLRNIILVPPEVMDPLYDLLKGKHPWDPKELTPQATESLDFIERQMSTSLLARWNPSVPLDLYVHFTQKGGVGALAQGPSEKSQPIQWVVLGRPTHAFSPGVECIANLITKGRRLALRHLGTEPARIHLPFRKRPTTESTAISEHLALALTGFGGEISYATKPPWTQLLTIVDIDVPPKVMDRPQPGPTVFTDASSMTSTAAAVWQAGETWHCIKTCDPTLSVQQLEAAAVVLACGLFQDEHLNIVTDSIFVAKLCLAMSRPGVSTSTMASMLEEALSSRQGTVSVIHVNSHNPVKGFFQTGNDKADAAAKGVWTLQEARQLHESLHIGAKALAKRCGISTADARHVVATCPHCQKSPLWTGGVNPRGLKASEIWQSDFTLCELLKPRAWLAVTVDTYSGVIIATQHLKPNSKATIQHWLTVMAWLGIPKQIKTDNASNFISKSVQEFASVWGITLAQGIPYNSTGQAIVERANQTLKAKLEVLAKAEGFANSIPSGDQTRMLATTLLALNQFPRGDEANSPIRKHWATQTLEEGPQVMVKNELGEWERGWRLVLTGRGYAAVKKEGKIRWCPLRSIKPDLKNETNGKL